MGNLALSESIFQSNRAVKAQIDQEAVLSVHTASGGAIYLNVADLQRWQIRRPEEDGIGELDGFAIDSQTVSPTISPTSAPTLSPTPALDVLLVDVVPGVSFSNLKFESNSAAVGGGAVFVYFYQTLQVHVNTDIIQDMKNGFAACCAFQNNNASYAEDYGALPAEIVVPVLPHASSYEIGKPITIEVHANDFFGNAIRGEHENVRVVVMLSSEQGTEFAVVEDYISTSTSFAVEHSVVEFMDNGVANINFAILRR